MRCDSLSVVALQSVTSGQCNVIEKTICFHTVNGVIRV